MKKKQKSIRKRKMKTEIGNVCIIQPHPSVVCWVFEVGDVKTASTCKGYLYERRMSVAKSVAKTETGLLPSRLANLCEKWLARITSPTSNQIFTHSYI